LKDFGKFSETICLSRDRFICGLAAEGGIIIIRKNQYVGKAGRRRRRRIRLQQVLALN
jgi:hypothetical protein